MVKVVTVVQGGWLASSFLASDGTEEAGLCIRQVGWEKSKGEGATAIVNRSLVGEIA